MQQLGQLLGVPLLLTRCSCSSWWFDEALCAACVFITDDNDGQAIEMAFSKRTVEDRKTWLSNYVPGTFLNMAGETVSYTDFVNKVRWLRAFLLPASCYRSMGSSMGSRSWLFSARQFPTILHP